MQKIMFEDDEEFFIPVPREYGFAEAVKFISGRLKRKKTILLRKAQEDNPNNPAQPCIYYVKNRGLGRLYKIRWQDPVLQTEPESIEEDDWLDIPDYQDAIPA